MTLHRMIYIHQSKKLLRSVLKIITYGNVLNVGHFLANIIAGHLDCGEKSGHNVKVRFPRRIYYSISDGQYHRTIT